MDDVGDPVAGHGALEGGGVGDVAGDHVDPRDLIRLHDDAHPGRLPGQVIGRDRRPFVDQALDYPGADAAEGAGDQHVFRGHVSSRGERFTTAHVSSYAVPITLRSWPRPSTSTTTSSPA